MRQVCLNSVTVLIFSFIQLNTYSQNPDIDLLKHINLDRNRSLDGTFRFVTNSAFPVSFGTPLIMCGKGLIKHDSS
jgi:hypothetical protein